MPLPPFLQNMPELEVGNELALKAFFDTSTDRPLGFGSLGPIPWGSVERWCDRNGIYGDKMDDLLFLIRSMDLAYMQWKSDEKSKSSPQPPP